MNIIELGVLEVYKKHHRGKENAITRDEFIETYWMDLLPTPADRQFRRFYSNIPICTCNTGGFYPIHRSEILGFREYMKKKAIPHFERFNRVRDAHPELTGDVEQLELF